MARPAGAVKHTAPVAVHSGGRPFGYNTSAYRGRNVIERPSTTSRRGLATRYDEHAVVYRGGLVLAAILIWRADLGDTS